VQVALSRFNLDAQLHIGQGEVVALLGPNGSGKSTMLRALAGLNHLTGGRVVLDGTVLEEPAAKVRVAPEKRPIALMFQEYLLFPHMSALENVAFGLRSRGMDRKLAREKAAAALQLLRLDGLDSARPREMSGGQQQRVAMARALVTEPKMLLLDEPLAALDASTKSEVRSLLRTVLRESPGANVLVTHDLLDALALSSRMVVIENGRIVQQGTPGEVTAQPRSPYVAELVGVNLLRGTANGDRIELDGGGKVRTGTTASGPVLAAVTPAAVVVARHEPVDNPPNCWKARIGTIELMGDRVRVKVEGTPPLSAEVPPSAVEELHLDIGVEVWTTFDPSSVTVYPA
jgi:molybdate transport system ATP-binding protein